MTFLIYSRLSITFSALGKKQSHRRSFCKNSQLYIVRVLRQLYKQDDMHTAFLLIQTQSGPTEARTQRSQSKRKKQENKHTDKPKQQMKQGSKCLPLEHHIHPAPCTWHFRNKCNPSTNHCKCLNIIYYILTSRRGGESRGSRGIKTLNSSCKCKRTVRPNTKL